MDQSPLRALPKMDCLLNDSDIRVLLNDLPYAAAHGLLREAVDHCRNRLMRENIRTANRDELFTEIKNDALNRLVMQKRKRFGRVINATGIILHTNLGRAPLSQAVIDTLRETASGYCNLEYSVTEGRRHDRNHYTEELLVALTGAEAALVVNNNAAAVYLALNTLSAEREVIVSRGEIVEIGDTFRIMDIIESSGCIIRETGATNRTRAIDYEKKINDRTAVLLKVHRSNYTITGYTEETTTAELASLAQKNPGQQIVVVEDMGSGLLIDLEGQGYEREKTSRIDEQYIKHSRSPERTVADVLRGGADIVTFSGDKLLGGPQAGIIAGKKELIQRMKRNPLYRCLRMDKLCLAALESTLMAYASGAYTELPVMRMLLEPVETVKERAGTLYSLLSGLSGLHIETGPHTAIPGGGAQPGETLESYAVYVWSDKLSAGEIERRLRQGTVPVVAVVQDGRVALDLRTVDINELPYIAEAVKSIAEAIMPPVR